jgi:predicted phage baseplate assembly protein
VTTPPAPGLVYEIANVKADPAHAVYSRLRTYTSPNVLDAPGVVQLQLPGVEDLQAWDFPDPMQEGTGDFPPKLEDEAVRARLITWLRIKRAPDTTAPSTTTSSSSSSVTPQAAQSGASLSARITWVGVNASSVYQAVPVFNEIVGTVPGPLNATGVPGEPDQVYFLAHGNVLPGSIRVFLQDVSQLNTSTVEQWRLLPLEDLLTARPTDKVFALDPEAGQLRFGDGLRGARPQTGWRIVASYEYGGGVQGNVGIGAIKTSRDASLQGTFKISNPLPTSGGSAAQTPAQGEQTVPLVIRHKDRLVTAADFHDLALETPGAGVGRVEVLPLFLPGSPDREDAAGVVTLMVVPQTDPVDPLWPVPDRAFLRRVCNYLEPRRLVTTEVHVEAPIYKPVYISVGISVRAGFFPDLVRKNVTSALQVYLSSLPPGGPFGGGWPLSRRLLKKDLEAVATRVPGVDYVESMELGVESPVDIDEYVLSGLQLPRVAGITVGEGPAEPLSSVFGTKPPPPPDSVVPIPVGPAKC